MNTPKFLSGLISIYKSNGYFNGNKCLDNHIAALRERT